MSPPRSEQTRGETGHPGAWWSPQDSTSWSRWTIRSNQGEMPRPGRGLGQGRETAQVTGDLPGGLGTRRRPEVACWGQGDSPGHVDTEREAFRCRETRLGSQGAVPAQTPPLGLCVDKEIKVDTPAKPEGPRTSVWTHFEHSGRVPAQDRHIWGFRKPSLFNVDTLGD